jgi:NDP-sugar pyrophosphorylase family protein
MKSVLAAAMVFAAGRGERMRPLSDHLPKPALPLPGGPLISSPLALANAAGCRRVAINTWHLAERMEAAVRGRSGGSCEVCFSREERLMGTAGGLALARGRGLLGDGGAVLVANGDCRVDLDLEPLLERHRRADDLVTLALLPHPDPRRWSVVSVDSAGRVVRIRGRGEVGPDERPLLYTGVMVVARTALDSLPLEPGGIDERLWRPALRVGRLGGVEVAGSWCEVGDPAAYLAAALALVGPGGAVDVGACFDPAAAAVSSWIGPGARVLAGATVVESVVVAGAVVGEAARVWRAVLLGEVEVGPGVEVSGEVRAAPPRTLP